MCATLQLLDDVGFEALMVGLIKAYYMDTCDIRQYMIYKMCSREVARMVVDRVENSSC